MGTLRWQCRPHLCGSYRTDGGGRGPLLGAVLHELGGWLGKAIIVLVHLLDPELIVIGGGLAVDAGQMLLPIVRKTVSDGVLPLTAQNLSIQVSELRELDWAIGASLLVGEKALEKLFLSKQEVPKSAARKARSQSRQPRTEEVGRGESISGV